MIDIPQSILMWENLGKFKMAAIHTHTHTHTHTHRHTLINIPLKLRIKSKINKRV